MHYKINKNLILNYINQHNLSKKQFCKNSNVSLPVLNKILNSNGNFRIIALFKISKVLKIPMYKLFIE